MSLKKKLTPYFLDALLSDPVKNFKRRLFDLKIALLPWLNQVTFYHRLNDPYSYLLLQALMEFKRHHSVEINIELVFDLPAELNPEQEKLSVYALGDVNRLSKFHSLDFPLLENQPSRRDTFQATCCLLKQKTSGHKQGDAQHFMHLVSEVTGALWGQNSTTFESCLNRYGTMPEDEARKILNDTVERLLANGHYMSAMLHYGGEWYWGVDRLDYLKSRLLEGNVKKHSGVKSSFEENYLSLTLKLPENKRCVDFYFSFRSPYSYLAAERLFKMASQLQFNINIKPVLPMVMRGFKIPKIKRLYIVEDVKREANQQGIPFGRICDPIDGGVERCLALFPYAQSESKERAFISSMARGIWSEGADLCDDEVLSKLLSRAGLDWQIGKNWLRKKDWQQQAEKNRSALNELGLWGVPSFAFDKEAIWGQDRLWAVEKAMQKTLKT